MNTIRKRIEKKDYTATDLSAAEFSVNEDFWNDAELVKPSAKKSVHLRLDEDVLHWFKSQGGGHITKMQTVLRSFYEAHSQ